MAADSVGSSSFQVGDVEEEDELDEMDDDDDEMDEEEDEADSCFNARELAVCSSERV